MSRAAILDYDAGNLTSVRRAVTYLGGRAEITRDRDAIRAATHIIFPGVGAAGAAMESLRRLELDVALREAHAAGRPILGICVGCQVVFERSEEDGGTECLGLLPGTVARFRFPEGVRRKVPHMGWNRARFVDDERRHPVFAGLGDAADFYFVHSYYPVPAEERDRQGMTAYGEVEFAAAVARENLVAVQFHAEKSGPSGLRIIENFLRWNP